MPLLGNGFWVSADKDNMNIAISAAAAGALLYAMGAGTQDVAVAAGCAFAGRALADEYIALPLYFNLGSITRDQFGLIRCAAGGLLGGAAFAAYAAVLSGSIPDLMVPGYLAGASAAAGFAHLYLTK